ncbi:MAG: hypothetical protein QOH88_1146 [Verrucomicrobiota bacterium]|jgi:uncharacterized protein YndB with AHSA1/START domain
MSDGAVHRATGQTWDEWFAILDAKGATQLAHKEIARYLETAHELPSWWAQTVTVAYERARGLRAMNQRSDGSFSTSVSRTVPVPVERLFAIWSETKLRAKWLADAPLTVRKATPNKSLRLVWNGGQSRVNVDFLAKGRSKSQVSLDHENLPNAASVKQRKLYWSEAMERMKIALAKMEPRKAI